MELDFGRLNGGGDRVEVVCLVDGAMPPRCVRSMFPTTLPFSDLVGGNRLELGIFVGLFVGGGGLDVVGQGNGAMPSRYVRSLSPIRRPCSVSRADVLDEGLGAFEYGDGSLDCGF